MHTKQNGTTKFFFSCSSLSFPTWIWHGQHNTHQCARSLRAVLMKNTLELDNSKRTSETMQSNGRITKRVYAKCGMHVGGFNIFLFFCFGWHNNGFKSNGMFWADCNFPPIYVIPFAVPLLEGEQWVIKVDDKT